MQKTYMSQHKTHIKNIVDEHYRLSSQDSNLNYLWYLYSKGNKKGEYALFIIIAELQLLKTMNYITKEEMNNILNMLESNDEDNLSIAMYSLINLRKKRISDHGEYGIINNTNYDKIIKNYSYEILNHEILLTLKNKT